MKEEDFEEDKVEVEEPMTEEYDVKPQEVDEEAVVEDYVYERSDNIVSSLNRTRDISDLIKRGRKNLADFHGGRSGKFLDAAHEMAPLLGECVDALSEVEIMKESTFKEVMKMNEKRAQELRRKENAER